MKNMKKYSGVLLATAVVVGGLTSATFDFSTLPGADKIKTGAIIQASDILSLSNALSELDQRTNGTAPSTDTDLVNKGFLDTQIANNPGPQGPKGDTGPQGPQGPAGSFDNTKDVDLNNHKITAMAPATANTDAVTLEQVYSLVSAAGGTNVPGHHYGDTISLDMECYSLYGCNSKNDKHLLRWFGEVQCKDTGSSNRIHYSDSRDMCVCWVIKNYLFMVKISQHKPSQAFA